MTVQEIKTPRGLVFQTTKGRAELLWNKAFVPHWEGQYLTAQQFVDSEVIRLSEPFTPLRTSMLIKSGTLGTQIGSGVVSWIAPYAAYQYYLARKIKSETGPLRGSFWFERMKQRFLTQIVLGARQRAGGSKR